MSFYTPHDFERSVPLKNDTNLPKEPYRTDFRRDFGRLVHCAAYRRLQGKTQLYPGLESDFFRNRLTHSNEVAQIAKSIAIRLNYLIEKDPDNNGGYVIDTDLIEFAGLAHDLGHPPFGHTGEKELNACMRNYGGFEGNAQTLRILSKLEKKVLVAEDHKGFNAVNNHTKRHGLNLTFRTLASIFKYDKEIPNNTADRVCKGYYTEEQDLVTAIKKHVAGDSQIENFKTIECRIMDIADDIAYATSDLEDALMAGLVTPMDMLTADDTLLEKIAAEVSDQFGSTYSKKSIQEILEALFVEFIFDRHWFESADQPPIDEADNRQNQKKVIMRGAAEAYKRSQWLGSDSYYRTRLITYLVGDFIRGADIELIKECPALSELKFDKQTKEKIEVLKHFNFHSQILSPRVQIVEYNGRRVIKSLFKIYSAEKGEEMLPVETRDLYKAVQGKRAKHRVICDHIAGMTDRHAFEIFSRLTGENSHTFFKPLTS